MYQYIFYLILFIFSLFSIYYKFKNIFPYLSIIKKLIIDKYNSFYLYFINNYAPYVNKIQLILKYILVLLKRYINKFQHYYIEFTPDNYIINYNNNIVFINNDLILSDSESDYSDVDEIINSIDSNEIVENTKQYISSKYFNKKINNLSVSNNINNFSQYTILYSGLYLEKDYINEQNANINKVDLIFNDIIKLHDSLKLNKIITNKLIHLINMTNEININLINKYINKSKYKYLLVCYTTQEYSTADYDLKKLELIKFKIINITDQFDYTIQKKLNFGCINL